MRKLIAAAALILLPIAIRAQQAPDFSKVEMKVTKVSGNIYMLEGQGGNIAASVGEDGIVIVDDEFAPLADKIQAALKNLAITDKPVRFVINTHYHGDHTGGNVPFNNAGSTIIAQDNVRKRLETGGVAGNGGSIKMENKPAEKAGLPIITFEHDVTVHLNGEDIRALHFPAGHTDGDSIIFFPKNNVVHMGDDFVRYGFPFIDVCRRRECPRHHCRHGESHRPASCRRKGNPRTRRPVEPGRRPRLHENVERNLSRGGSRPESPQNTGPDETRENPGPVEQVLRRLC